MTRLRRSLGLLVVITAASASVGHAQPTIPKGQIPAGLPENLRENIEGLYSEDPGQRFHAAAGLGGWSRQSTAVIPFLVAMLHDEAVIYDEAQLQARSMISSSLRVLSYPNGPGQVAAEVLGGIGGSAAATGPVVNALLVPLNEGQGTARANALRALAEMLRHFGTDRRAAAQAQPALEPTLAALKDANPKTREYAAEVLRGFGDPRAVEPLVALLGSEKAGDTRKAAVAALGAIGDPRAVETLIAVLEGPSEDIDTRAAAAEALGQIGDLRAVEPMIRAFRDEDWQIRHAALSVAELARDYRVLRPLVIDALKDEEWRVRSRAGSAAERLGQLKDPEAFGLLAQQFDDQHPNVRASAARSLAELKDPRAVPLLIEAQFQPALTPRIPKPQPGAPPLRGTSP
jgi:HEAT repeat protein